ncbi:DMT family transporter [Lampropedia puyangensis]|uniref:DMT family transporter n=1 Tax=Lampropedia puyangensis TaxID=1330072 RepID=A0A4S8F9A0_9BURK|nr:DMT family transporter [Lampropedia puyangensis]THU02844.1 DMT family transporter [Lampropedia puyangensis]
MSSPTAPSALTGILLTCMAVVFFGLLDSSVRYVAVAVPVLMALWVRYAIHTALTMAMLRKQTGNWLPHSNNWSWQIVRACCFVLSNIFAFLSLRYMKVAEFTAIALIAPVIVSILAMLVLHEKLSFMRWLLLPLALMGALVIVRPGNVGMGWFLLFPLMQVAANVVYLLVTAHVARYDEPLTTHLYTGALGLVLASAVLPFFWQTPDFHWTFWPAMLAGGICGTVGHLLLIHAYRFASSTVLMPYLYVQVAVATLLGWLFFDNMPDATSLIGIAMIVASGVGGALLTVGLRPSPAAQ